MSVEHWARHVDPESIGVLLEPLSEVEMDSLLDDPKCSLNAVPCYFNYKNGALRVWPQPATGWNVIVELK